MFRLLFLLALLGIAVGSSLAQNLPPGDGQEIVKAQCSGCHELKVVTSKRASRAEWSRLVDQMMSRGAEIEDEDYDTVVNYLSKNFHPEASGAITSEKQPGTVCVNSASASQLAAALAISNSESESIVKYRQEHGNFKKWQELANVPGIEMEKIEKNKDHLVF